MRQREQYLEALGIDAWKLRVPPGPALAEPVDQTGVWAVLQEEVRVCRRCALCETRTQTVFGVGNRRAEILVIGEAPGQDEDEQGEPFVGRAGQLLNSMLRALGHPRETVYIAKAEGAIPALVRDTVFFDKQGARLHG